MSRPAHLPAQVVADLLRDTDPYLSCDDCFERLDAYVERLAANPRHEDLAMRVHLAGCGACAEEAATLMELLAADDDPRA